MGIRVHGACWAPSGVAILKDFSLTLEKGQITALLGRSGCGKSSLLRLLAGLRPLDQGRIEGVPARCAFVFQDAALLPWRTVRENVALPGEFTAIQSVEEALSSVGLLDLSDRLPGQLSGGQKMRVSLARALVAQPELVLLDEAFAALDGLTRRSVQRAFLDLSERFQWTVLLVTHEPEDALRLADRVMVVDGPPLRTVLDFQVPQPRPRNLSQPPPMDLLGQIEAIFRDSP